VLFRPGKRLKEVISEAGVKLVDKKVYNADTHSRGKKTQENSDNE
jgi:hypothetical protein